MKSIFLRKQDLLKIVSIMDKFPDADIFELVEHSQSGIGSLLDLKFDAEVNNVRGKMVVSIVDESQW